MTLISEEFRGSMTIKWNSALEILVTVKPLQSTLSKLITRLSRQYPITSAILEYELQFVDVSGTSRKQLSKEILRILVEYRTRNQLGRFRAGLFMSLKIMGEGFLGEIERAGLLLSPDSYTSKFEKFLKALSRECAEIKDPMWNALSERLNTYIAYCNLVAEFTDFGAEVSPLLRNRPRDIIQKILALTNLQFFRMYFNVEVPSNIAEYLDELGTPEDLASIASILVVLANECQRLDGFDFKPPMSDNLLTPEVRKVLQFGNAVRLRHEIGKDIAYFQYELEFHSQERVFYIRPPSLGFEYFRKLGFIRSEIGIAKAGLDVSTTPDISRVSFQASAEAIAVELRSKLHEIADANTPFRRVRTFLWSHPEIYKRITPYQYYEDFTNRARLDQEFLVPLMRKGQTAIHLTDNLDLVTFDYILRYLQFFCMVDIYILKPFAMRDPLLFCNSLTRVMSEKDMLDLLEATGVSKEQVSEFFKLVTADTGDLGYFDLQYRPYLKIGPSDVKGINSPAEIVHLSGVVATSQGIRNVQCANRLRLGANADLFVECVGGMLKEHFKRVEINRPVKSTSKSNPMRTDIDVLLLENGVLYIFECKHSIPPTSPHEMRDIWEEIKKGVSQLKKAIEILNDTSRLTDYLRGWFPDLPRNQTVNIKIVPCVLCSHRIFSGMAYEGIPIRDFSSLAKLIEDGLIKVGVLQDRALTLSQFRIAETNKFSIYDLADYLSEDSRFFKMFKAFMFPTSRIQRVGNITLARETWLYEVEMNKWLSWMTSIGCTRLEDERAEWKSPLSAQELIASN
jgi:hypothetical protein